MTEPEGSARELAGEVALVCAEVADQVAALGDPRTRERSAADLREEVERSAAGEAYVVVVGEKKRGKSSLINALLERPDLLPVEIDVATNVHLVVRYGPEPKARAVLEEAAEPRPIGLEEVALYAALDPRTGRERRDDVRSVVLETPSELLASGLALIDTPGVGGLVSGHAQVTKATLRDADALVFVVNGSSELTGSELRFLGEATGRIATVFFVLTQIDKYPEWRRVLERDRALLAEHAPRYADAPWHAVSSRAELEAVRARARGEAERARRRAAQSGVDELREALTVQVAERAGLLRLRNALHLGGRLLDPLVDAEERRVRSLSQDPRAAEEVDERRRRLRELQREDARWRATLTRRLGTLERELRLGFQRSVNDLRALGEEKIATCSRPELLQELPGDLEAGVQAAWMELESASRRAVGELLAALAAETGQTDVEIGVRLSAPDRLRELPGPTPTRHDSGGVLGTLERGLPLGGAGILAGTAVSFLTGGLFLPLAAGLGVIGLISTRRRRREELARARGDAAKYLMRLVAELHTEVPPKITEAVGELGDRLREDVSARLDRRRGLLEEELAEHQRNLRADKERLDRERDAARRRHAALVTLRERVAGLRDRLDHLDQKGA